MFFPMLCIRRFAHRELYKYCKVCIIGANGGIGRSLAANLKINHRINDISLHDIESTDGVRVDLSHINTSPRIAAFSGMENIEEAVECSDIVIIVAGDALTKNIGDPKKLFERNAVRIACFVESCIFANEHHEKQPHIHIVTNPVDALVPLAAGILKKHDYFNPTRLSGSVSSDSMRAATFLGEHIRRDPSNIYVPILGGHSVKSTVPILSETHPELNLPPDEQIEIAKRIVNAPMQVINAKNGLAGSHLMMGYCVSKFVNSLVRSHQGERKVIETAYVPYDVDELPYFACRFELNTEGGIGKFLKLPPLTEHEEKMLNIAKEEIKKSINLAEEFLKKHKYM